MKRLLKYRPHLLALAGAVVLGAGFINFTFLDTVNEVISQNVGRFDGADEKTGEACQLVIKKNPDFNSKSQDGSGIEYYIASPTLNPDGTAVYAEHFDPDNNQWRVVSKDSALEYRSIYTGKLSKKILLRFDKRSHRILSAEFSHEENAGQKPSVRKCLFKN